VASTIAFNLVDVCPGGGHFTVGVSRDGGPVRNFIYTADDLISNLGQIDEPSDVALAMLKLHFVGMTRAQARAALQAGITITI
jgi:hypothetical protein